MHGKNIPYHCMYTFVCTQAYVKCAFIRPLHPTIRVAYSSIPQCTCVWCTHLHQTLYLRFSTQFVLAMTLNLSISPAEWRRALACAPMPSYMYSLPSNAPQIDVIIACRTCTLCVYVQLHVCAKNKFCSNFENMQKNEMYIHTLFGGIWHENRH